MRPVHRQGERRVRSSEFLGNPEPVGMHIELRRHREWLWTFPEVDGVEPTNNAGERALRRAVEPAKAVVRLAESTSLSLRGHNLRCRRNPPITVAKSRRPSRASDAKALRRKATFPSRSQPVTGDKDLVPGETTIEGANQIEVTTVFRKKTSQPPGCER
jgi:hypothetical protein